MRFPKVRIIHAAFFSLSLLSLPLAASEVISQETLDQTLLDARNAIEREEFKAAFALYDQAARWGHKGAQYVLGELYNEGKGVARDPVRGYAWLTVAAEAPDRDFRRALKRAGQALSDAEKAQAERLAREYAGIYGMEAAGVYCKKESRVGSNIKRAHCYHRNTTGNGDLIVPDADTGAQPAS
ncbi:tetratricopeptide repeat protein [Elongatibacter sediminis]|uniref:Sel1 repeat family protein n=1 Tax=Elongatibacter sediminis TaxID=3119006 RepID=A0AAW9R956_9GAMM